jgi:dTDP-4-amino-4,6-dideoxygalactose transaminase
VYWFLRLRLDADRMRVDKNRFCEALAAEGIPVTAAYRHIPCESPWFRDRAVFGDSGFPWTCPGYKGPANPRFRVPNAVRSVETHFNMAVHERYGRREIADILRAVEKVETAYLQIS